MISTVIKMLTTKIQAMIAKVIRSIIALPIGDSVVSIIARNRKSFIQKAAPIDFEFARALEGTLESEWLSKFDEEIYRDL